MVDCQTPRCGYSSTSAERKSSSNLGVRVEAIQREGQVPDGIPCLISEHRPGQSQARAIRFERLGRRGTPGQLGMVCETPEMNADLDFAPQAEKAREAIVALQDLRAFWRSSEMLLRQWAAIAK